MKIKKSYSYTFLFLFLASAAPHGQAQVTNLTHSNTYATIHDAVKSAVAGDRLQIDAGTFVENDTINKSIVLTGSGSTTVIAPTSGNGITVSSNGVTINNLRITGAPKYGIYASGVSTLTLNGIVCDADSVGTELINVIGLTVTGCTFSNNQDFGLYSSGGQNFTMQDCIAKGNGKTKATGSGMKFSGLAGSSTITNSTVDSNKCHGIEIGGGAGAKNITINGGEFNSNGSNNLFNGGGIYIFARTAKDSNITINGPLVANNNITCGIYVDANTSSSDIIYGLTIGQAGGAVSFTGNGTTSGAGILLFGNISNVTMTANFSKGTVSSSAGVMIIGQNTLGDYSPQNVTIANCTFYAGYTNTTPAISLANAQSYSYMCKNNVTATGNTFLGLSNLSDVPTVIYDHADAPALGEVQRSGDMLPVELVSLKAEAVGNDVHLRWSTATEVNNYGFEVERRVVESLSNGEIEIWRNVGFVHGSGTSNIPESYGFTDANVSSGTYVYRLKQIDKDGSFKYSMETQVTKEAQKIFALYQNYPNPFNPTTTIEFTIPETGEVLLAVYNVLGQKVRNIFYGAAEARISHKITFDGSALPSGLYFFYLDFGRTRVSRKMTLIK